MIKKILKNISFGLILLIFFSNENYSQTLEPDFIWANNFGGLGFDNSYDVVVDNSGNIIATGSFTNIITFGSFQLQAMGTSQDIFIVKLTPDGQVIWAKSAGGGDFDRANGITVDNADNIIITGNFGGRAFFDTMSVLTNGNYDIFIAKYSPNGNVLWVTNYGDSEYQYGYDVATDNLNNILVTGVSQTFGSVPLPVSILTLKYNSLGIFQWVRAGVSESYNSSGYGIATNSLNEVFVVGCAADTVNFSGTPLSSDVGGDIFLVKYNAAGTFNWVRQAGFNNNNDEGAAVTVDENDDIYVTGHFRDDAVFGSTTLIPIDFADIFVAKYDQLGNLLWVSQDSLIDQSYARGISLDSAGNISVIGSYFISQQENNSIIVERFSNDGLMLWNKLIATPPSYGYPGGIDNDEIGDIVISGYYYSTQSQTEDIIIGKLPAPSLSANPNPYNFGAVEPGLSSSNTFTFSNNSSATLFLLNTVLAGPNAGDFSVLDLFPQTILSQQSINIDIEFSPLTAGLKTAYLIIESDAPTSPDTLLLRGSGGLQNLTFSADTLDFGNVEINDSLDLNLTILNLTSVDIAIDNYMMTNTEYQLVNPVVPDTIPNDNTRIITIRFKPSAPGLRTGYLVITGSSGSSPDSIYLNGVGEFPSLTYSSNTLNFGTVDVNNSADLTLTITNESMFDRIVNKITVFETLENNFSLINPPLFPATIPSLGFLNINVRFSPSTAGLKIADLNIVSDSSDQMVIRDTISLLGDAIETIIVNLPDSSVVGQSTLIDVNSPGPAFTENQFFYRRTGENIYQQDQLSLSGLNYTGSIPPAYSTIRGIQFYIVFTDPIEGVTVTYPTNNPLTNPASIEVNIPQMNFPLNIMSNKYQMISIPLSITDPQLGSVLEDDYGSYDNRIWRLFRWNPSENSYSEFDDITDDFQPGNSFWLINRNDESFNVENARSVPSNNFYTITLLPGWNQIANPFAFPVAWNSIENSNLLSQAPAKWNADAEEYEYDQTILNPWEGYWVYDSSMQVINLNVPPIESPLGLEKNILASFSSSEFLLQLKAKIEQTNFQDNQNFIGMKTNASSSYDEFDIIEAPPITNNLRLSISSGDKLYARNVVPLSSDGAYWDLKITSQHENKNVNLKFEEKKSLPENFYLWLLDLDENFSVPVINNSATINLGNKEKRNLRLIIGSEDFAKGVAGNISLIPDEYILFQNFPNPFNPETIIYFSLKENSNVTIEIFDILGRRVTQLVKGETLNAGLHNVVWNGTDLTGSKVSTGIYIYRIKANDFTDSKKMILLK